MKNFPEEHKVVNVGHSGFIAANDDLFNGNPATDVVNMSQWERITFILQKGAGATGKATLTVESCDDVTPTTTAAIPFSYRKATSGGHLFPLARGTEGRDHNQCRYKSVI